jgi:short-subunit dehydrogenase
MEQCKKTSAIVTGASSGIGLAISSVLCEMGYEVYGFGRDFSGVQPVFHAEVCDLLEEGKLCERVKEIARSTRVEVLVNAAGVGYYGLHEELSVRQIQTLVRTNLEVPLVLTNRLLRTLKEHHGTIINISSVTAKQKSPHGCAYGRPRRA